MSGHVYIMASRKHGTLYVGVTSNLARRAWEHREGLVEGFLSVTRPDGWFTPNSMTRSKRRFFVKQIKEWKRDWKIRLIEEQNPDWPDLYSSVVI